MTVTGTGQPNYTLHNIINKEISLRFVTHAFPQNKDKHVMS